MRGGRFTSALFISHAGMKDSAWAVRPTVIWGVVKVRKLFAVMAAVALLTLSGFAVGNSQHHGFGQIVANGESGGGD